MIDKLKIYLLEVVVPKYIPTAVIAAFSWLGVYLAAHSGMFEPWGVTYGVWPLHWPVAPTGPVLVIELDTLQGKIIPFLGAAFTMLIVAIKHHTVAAVTGAPQSGDKRETPPQPVEGGTRKDDPPKGEDKK